jgi:hypothetical protein
MEMLHFYGIPYKTPIALQITISTRKIPILGGYQKQEQMPLVVRVVLRFITMVLKKKIKEPVPDL